MILGNDGAGTLDDGTKVIIYPVLGSPDWRGEETPDPRWHTFSGTFSGVHAPERRWV
jgi:hypothetical protein